MGLRWWQTADEMAVLFAQRFPAQTDADFLAECKLGDNRGAVRIALAVRRSVARYGMVSPEHIRAGHSYPGELESLSGWDSLDFLAWLFELERELDQKINFEFVRHLRFPFTVRDLAQTVYARMNRPE
jgi:hypothetical protein